MSQGIVAQLKSALRDFVASVEGEQPTDAGMPPVDHERDSPGARAAQAASVNPNSASPHSGQATTHGRQRHLPEKVVQAVSDAKRLLGKLEQFEPDRTSPGANAARAGGGLTPDVAQKIRAGWGMAS